MLPLQPSKKAGTFSPPTKGNEGAQGSNPLQRDKLMATQAQILDCRQRVKILKVLHFIRANKIIPGTFRCLFDAKDREQWPSLRECLLEQVSRPLALSMREKALLALLKSKTQRLKTSLNAHSLMLQCLYLVIHIYLGQTNRF